MAALLIVGLYIFKYKQDFEENAKGGKETTVPPTKNVQSVTLDGKEYAFAWIQIGNPKNLFLYANFEEKYTLEEVVKKYNCENLVSGGFYSEDYFPIGLFISEAEVISTKTNNLLFNGYFTLTKKGEALINRGYFGESVRIGLQTGPLLIQDGLIRELKLANDKMARRIIAALSGKNELFFIVFYDSESVFLGPLLNDLPSLVKKAQNEMGVEFISAINLDGGSASAFYNKGIQLSELTPVGSFFCEK